MAGCLLWFVIMSPIWRSPVGTMGWSPFVASFTGLVWRCPRVSPAPRASPRSERGCSGADGSGRSGEERSGFRPEESCVSPSPVARRCASMTNAKPAVMDADRLASDLSEGVVAVIPTDTVVGLAVRPLGPEHLVSKRRPAHKPLILMGASTGSAPGACLRVCFRRPCRCGAVLARCPDTGSSLRRAGAGCAQSWGSHSRSEGSSPVEPELVGTKRPSCNE